VNLHRHPQLTQVSKPTQGGVKGPGDAAESVVRGSVGAVEADGNSPDAGFDTLPGYFLRYLGAIGGQRHAQTTMGCVGCQFKDVGPIERLATAQNQDWRAEL